MNTYEADSLELSAFVVGKMSKSVLTQGRFFHGEKPMSETIEDMKNMFANEISGVIVVDVSGCRLSHCKHIVLRHIIRL